MNNQDEYRNYQNNQNHSNQLNSNSGLLRFRSAPNSLLSNFNSVGTDYGEKSSSPENVMHDLEESKPFANGYCLSSSQLPPQYPRQSNTGSSYGGFVGSNHLIRQSSSPAGIFSPQNGYASLRSFGNYRVGNGTNDGDVSPSSSRLRSPMNFSPGVPSTLGMLSQISELEDESVVRSDIKLGNGSREPQFFPFGSWSESSHFPENYSLMKRDLDYDGKLFAGTHQNGELEHRAHNLSHHLSLPKTAAEMERLLQFQDTVPCKVRAKRGCATHPRSIAERVRRTRISERMRKLQDLVPNMDKQTNTADMLDLAVEYIKDLQKQYKILNEYRANCKCSSIQKAFANLSA